jgi:O-antigen ligase
MTASLWTPAPLPVTERHPRVTWRRRHVEPVSLPETSAFPAASSAPVPVAAPRPSAAVAGLAVYALIIIARVPELAPSLRLAFVWLGLTIAAVVLFPPPPLTVRVRRTEVALVVTLFVMAIVSTPLGLWPGGSAGHLINVNVKLVILFWLVAFCGRSVRDLGWLAAGLLAGVFLLEGIAIAAAGGGRVKVTEMYDPNDIAFVMSCTFPLATAIAVGSRGVMRFAAGTVAVLAVPTIVFTKSRGGFMSLAVIGTCVLVRLTRGRPFVRMGAAAAALAIFLVATPADYWDRIATIWGGGDDRALSVDTTDDEAATEAKYDRQGIKAARWDIWMTGVDMMLSHPLLGVGPGAFVVGEAATHGGRGAWTPAHNSFLQLGAELGIPALVVFLWLLGAAIVTCRTASRRLRDRPGAERAASIAQGVELCLYGYLLNGFSLSQAYSPILYFLLGLAAVLRRLVAGADASEGPAR